MQEQKELNYGYGACVNYNDKLFNISNNYSLRKETSNAIDDASAKTKGGSKSGRKGNEKGEEGSKHLLMWKGTQLAQSSGATLKNLTQGGSVNSSK